MKTADVFKAFFFCGLVSCQIKPTAAVSEAVVQLESPKFQGLILSETVVFDTRSTFDFNLSHVPGSVNLMASDFNPEADPLDAAKRLALYGVQPSTPVLVVGTNQMHVHSLAWRMASLGIAQVETLSLTAFKAALKRPEPLRKNVALWTPSSEFGTLPFNQLRAQLQSSYPASSARSQALQNPAVARALVKRTLILKTDNSPAFNEAGYARLVVRQFPTETFFDGDFFLRKKLSLDVKLDQFDRVYLLDASDFASSRALVLKASGAKSIWIVR